MRHAQSLLGCVLLVFGGCKSVFAKTSVVVFAEYPAALQVDQIRFTAAEGANTIFGPVARPFAEGGGALAPPQSIRFDVNDEFGGKTASIHVTGFWQGKEVTNGDKSFTFKKLDFVEVHVIMTDLHTDCSKCTTCCQDGFCLDATGLGACGIGGKVCVTCDPVRADNCSEAGVCQCGTGGLECAGGQHCVGGTCTCDDISCLGGCCDGNNCKTRTLSSCGANGGTCTNCGDVESDGCSATGACRCGIDAPCGANLHCVAGACVCDDVGCKSGCCENNTCFSGNGDINKCGNGGFACAACPQTPVAQTCSTDGQCSGCNSITCGDGCCSGTCTHQFGLTACGIPGGLCSACDDAKADTCDHLNGTCKCGSNAACGSGQRCSSGQCICDQTSCTTGCCSGNVCLAGQTAGACGTGGNACSSCNSGNCNQGVCADCTPTNCNGGCCTGSVCNAPNHTTGCQVSGGACIACDTKSDNCAGGQCVCGATGAACAPGQECVSSQCQCDTSSCSAAGACCSGSGPGSTCVSATATTCGTRGAVCAMCIGTTDACSSGSAPQPFTCECGSGATCPNNSDGASANLCSGGACRCGSTGAACGAGLKCSGSGASGTCICDVPACAADGGCCNVAGTACVTTATVANCGAGGTCAQCTSGSTPTDTCNPSKLCQCGSGSCLSCPTSAGGVTNANVCVGGACVCGATGAACGAGLKCSGSGAAATCVCDVTACGAQSGGGCCTGTGVGSSCVTGAVTATACGKVGSPPSDICVDCTVGSKANVCASGACQCGNTGSICGAGMKCTGSGAASTFTCTCDTASCGAQAGGGCCRSDLSACVAGSSTLTACGKSGVNGGICLDCATGARANACTSGVCTCGSVAQCASGQGLSCTGSGAGSACTCDATKCSAASGCCNLAGTACVTTGANIACGTSGATCINCASLYNDQCVSGMCTCNSTTCAGGCCSTPSGATSVCRGAGAIDNSHCSDGSVLADCMDCGPLNERCKSNACVQCNSGAGCWDATDTCHADGPTNGHFCGTSDGVCVDCDAARGTTGGCSGGACACNPTTCPAGCCDGGGNCLMLSNSTCGTGPGIGVGTACVVCGGGTTCDTLADANHGSCL